MSQRYWSDEWPNLNSISISLDVSSAMLTPSQVGALYRLAWFSAAQVVQSAYSDKTFVMGFPDDKEKIIRIIGCSPQEWAEIKYGVLEFFSLVDGVWRLSDESQVRFTRPGRLAISLSTKLAATTRDGERCVYCGDTDGPFHLDHLWPVCLGGTNDESNIVISCAQCNLSKGGRSLREWMESFK